MLHTEPKERGGGLFTVVFKTSQMSSERHLDKKISLPMDECCAQIPNAP